MATRNDRDRLHAMELRAAELERSLISARVALDTAVENERLMQAKVLSREAALKLAGEENTRHERGWDQLTAALAKHALFEENWCRIRKRRSDVEFVSLRAAQVLRDLAAMVAELRKPAPAASDNATNRQPDAVAKEMWDGLAEHVAANLVKK